LLGEGSIEDARLLLSEEPGVGLFDELTS